MGRRFVEVCVVTGLVLVLGFHVEIVNDIAGVEISRCGHLVRLITGDAILYMGFLPEQTPSGDTSSERCVCLGVWCTTTAGGGDLLARG